MDKLSVCYLFIAAIIGIIDVSGGRNDFTFGDCEPGKESCRDCYLTLAKSLLGIALNVFTITG